MTGDEARELFSEAYDGALDTEQQAAFDTALADSDAVRQEYEELRELLDIAHGLDADAEDPLDEAAGLAAFTKDADDTHTPDLLRGVQARIRERSGGRFYRDRFAERQRGLGWTPLILALIMALVLGVAYVGLTYVQVQSDTPASSAE